MRSKTTCLRILAGIAVLLLLCALPPVLNRFSEIPKKRLEYTVEEVELHSDERVRSYGIVDAADQIYESLSAHTPIRETRLENEDTCILTYDPDDLKEYFIPDLFKLSSFAKIDDSFSISYTTRSDEYVIVQYYPDGSYSYAVNTDLKNGNEVIEYSSSGSSFKKYHFTETDD